MIVVLAVALMFLPLVALYFLERAARKGTGPLADPDRIPVLDGLIMMPTMLPMAVPPELVQAQPMDAEPVFPEPADAGRCAEESQLVRRLLDGELDREQYRTEMAALAAGIGSQQ